MLRVRLLGPMEVERDGEVIPAPASRRAWALLAWLALHPGEHARGHVAARFWPDVLDSSARASLRSAVWALRRALGADGAIVVAGRERLGVDPDAAVWVDVRAFDDHVDAGRLVEAAELVRGELLAGFADDWALQARDEFRDRLSSVLERLAGQADTEGDTEAAIAWARRRTALDPLDEAAHRDLMSRLADAGDRAGAMAMYGRLRERLGRELGVAPAPATRELAERVRYAEPARGDRADAEPAAVGARALPLIGREREFGDLLDRWAAAREGAGAVVTLAGEPGIGKTRLATELLARAQADGAHFASCAALDLGGAAPLSLWAELIRELSRDVPPPPLDAAWPADLSPLAPDIERRFGREPVERPRAAPDLERARLFEAAVELVEWAARRGPLVLLMEDVHIADAPSLQLVGYLARRIGSLPVLVVLTRRSLPPSAEADALEHALRARGVLAAELTLGPLPADALARLVREVAPLEAPEVDGVVAAAEGNALLAVEGARAVGRGEQEPPASLRGAVRIALAPLAPPARLAAEFAAVAGRELSRAELESLPIERPADAATEALRTGLLGAAGRGLGYRHALLRDAVYADLAEPHRAWLHETLAGTLSAREDAPELAAEEARHLRLAGRDDLAGAALARAARHARAVTGLDEAAAFLEEALSLAPDDAELRIELAEVDAWRGRMETSDANFDRALGRLEEEGGRLLADAWMRRAIWYRGPLCVPHEVLAAARRTLEVLDADAIEDESLRQEALTACAWAEAVAGEPEEAERLLEEVHRRGIARAGDDLLVHGVGIARATALIRSGRFEDSYAPSIAAGEAAVRAGRPDLSYGAWVNAACAAACVGEFGRALEFVDRGQEALAGRGLLGLEIQYLAARSYILTRLGRLEEARAESAAEAELAERLGNPGLRATAEHDEGLVALALGDHERAADRLGQALAHDAPVSRPLARLARAEALVRLGRCDEAEEELRATALEPVGPSDFPDTLVPRLTRIQGLIAAGRGDQALAARRLEEAIEGWRRRLDRSADGDRYTATLADLGRPPVLGLVEADRELARVQAELREVQPTTV